MIDLDQTMTRALHSDVALKDLLVAACEVRAQAWGQQVSYSRKVFLPLTTYCRNVCGYCTFYKVPGETGARYMDLDEVEEIARQGERLGCKEALFSLGERPELLFDVARERLAQLGHDTTVDYLAAACERVLHTTTLIPHVNAGRLEEHEILRLRDVSGSMGMMLESGSKRLMKAGMAHHACPDKSPRLRLRTLETAGRHGVPFTTGILIGIGETWQERLDSLKQINRIHREYGHIQEVIIQNFRPKPGTPMADHAAPAQREMLMTLAAARLILDPGISLQAPPNLEDAFEDYLDAGINDWGGVSPLTADHINPERAWPAITELSARTSGKGMELVERLTVYPTHFERTSPALQGRLMAMAQPDGLARRQVLS